LFKKNLSANEAKKVFDGFFRKDAGPASLSACENFAPGLGLSKATSPRAFNPEGNVIFGFIKKRLEENDYELPVWKLYQELNASPYGVIREIITLSLLCFVRYGDPSVEIRLKDGHRQPIRGSRLTSFNVPEIEWKGRFEEDFDVLSRSTEVNWNDIVHLARVAAPEQDLKTATKPEEIMEQEKRLLNELAKTLERIPNVIANLQTLWSSFGKEFIYSRCLENVRKICDAKNYGEFQEVVIEVYGQDFEAFKTDFEAFRALSKLSDQATVIISMRSYLDQAVLPAEKADLNKLKVSIEDQLNPELFVKDLAKLEKIKKHFEEFKRQYIPLYQIHHRDYYEEVEKNRKKLDSVSVKIDVISRLNKLGMNLTPSKLVYSDVLMKTKTCEVRGNVNVDSFAVCNECKLTLVRKFDDKEFVALMKEVDEGIRLGMIGLRQMLTKPILELDKEKRLGELAKALQSDGSQLFVKVFSDSLVEYLVKLFEKANIETIALSVSEFVQKYAFVEEDRIEDVVKAFRNELMKIIEKAKKEKPGKKIRIALGE